MKINRKWLAATMAALLYGAAAAAQPAPEKVQFDSLEKGSDKQTVKIDGYLYKPDGLSKWPAIVMLHGCAGVVNKNGTIKRREREAAQQLVKKGYGVLVVDSHTTRGEASLCSTKLSERPVRGRQFRLDSFGALDYLSQRADVVKGQVAVFGQTFAGNYALNSIDANLLPYGSTKNRFAASVGLSPSCSAVYKRKKTFQAYAPLLLLSAENAEKNPAKPCQQLAERSKANGDPVEIHVYAGAEDGFYFSDKRGGNQAAREDAFARIDDFLKRAFSDKIAVGAPAAVAVRRVADEDLNPEGGSGYTEKELVRAKHFMVASANPLASEAGYEMLKKGGSAMDAAIATQLVLNLTEPQSSGIGGGAFIVYYNKTNDTLKTYDGRETAPASATPERFMRGSRTMSFSASVNSGLSVGVPGLLRAMELAHKQQGKLPWADLFAPAIRIAEEGFPVSHRLHTMIAKSKPLAEQSAAAAYFFDRQGKAWPIGHVLKNPQLAEVFRQVAQRGADAFYTGDIARDIVAAVNGHKTPGNMTLSDLSGYQAKERAPVCGTYHTYRVCGMPPPSSGVIGVLQMLGILEQFPVANYGPTSQQAVHYFSEAGRLAYADRDYYVADPDFVDVPVKGLIDPVYLKARASLIEPDMSMGVAPPGDPVSRLAELGQDDALEVPSTSHIVAVDAEGNVLSMTTTIESVFGSKIFVRGFLLNNQITDFSRNPIDDDGKLVANRIEPNKRPRSTMAPIIVFRDELPFMAIGSPGGSAIMNYVAKTLVGVIDWNLDIQRAISLPNYGSRNKQTELERGTELEQLAQPLRAMGHDVNLLEFPSGLQGIVIDQNGLSGGADPRREGTVLGS